MIIIPTITISACLLYIGWAILRAVDDSISRRRRQHAEALLISAADSVSRHWVAAVKAGRHTGKLRSDELAQAHSNIMARASTRAREDRFDIITACGGHNGFDAMAWLQTKRIA